jgi:hypothetical protein
MYKNKSKFHYLFILAAVIATLFAPAVFAQTTTATTSSGIQAVANTFSDVSRTHQYYTAITFMNESGVVSGYEDGTFKPENPINRAEALKIILKGSSIEADQEFKADFPDVKADQWFALYVIKAKAMGLVKGNDSDGTFAPSRQVNLAEFVKILLLANAIDVSSFQGKTVVPNIPADAWYANYINYAASLGLLAKDAQGNIDASKLLTRGEVMNIMYLLNIIRKGQDTQFLLNRAEAELAQIEVYIAANQITFAKNASDLAVDITQQAYKNMPENAVVLGAAKIARAYNLLVDAFILGVQGKKTESADMANQAIDKAAEAWEANNSTQPIAKHIKDRAREILAQVGGTEN